MQVINIFSGLRTFRSISNNSGTGFALIELLVVIAILGVLSSVVALATICRTKDARDVVRKSDLAQIRNALEVYYVEKLHYPDPRPPDLVTDSLVDGPNWIPGLVLNYLKTIPKDPKQAGLLNIGNFAFKPGQGRVAAATSTLSLGSFVGTGALGFKSDVSSAKWNLPYMAGQALAMQWAQLEPTDDNFNFTWFDNKLGQLKAAGKKGSLRVSVGPSSPDWLRTQKNIKTLCWSQSGGNVSQPFNCFPWMIDPDPATGPPVYRDERKEMLEATVCTVKYPTLDILLRTHQVFSYQGSYAVV